MYLKKPINPEEFKKKRVELCELDNEIYQKKLNILSKNFIIDLHNEGHKMFEIMRILDNLKDNMYKLYFLEVNPEIENNYH